MLRKAEIIAAVVAHYKKIAAMHETSLADVQLSIANEGKRTAGDKHETALALLQTEQERIAKQLSLATACLRTMNLLSDPLYSATNGMGLLITTDKGQFFLAVAVGKLDLPNKNVYAISPDAPIAQKLIETPVGKNFTQHKQMYNVVAKE